MDQRGVVEDDILPGTDGARRALVAQIHLGEANPRLRRRRHEVGHRHLVAATEQRRHQRPPHEAAAPGHQTAPRSPAAHVGLLRSR